MRIDQITEKWSQKYKRSIDCSNPKGFSQKAHCAGRKKKNESIPSPDQMGKPTLPSLQNTIQDLNDLIKDLDKGKPQPKEIILDPEDYREKRKEFKKQGKPYMITKVDEGVNDPHIFKAVFMAGGPGSGKSFVAKNLLGGTGLRTVNSDEVYEFLMKRQGLSLDPDVIASPQGQDIRTSAKDLTTKRQENYLDGRLGLLIDGTGKNPSVIQELVQKLKSIGYSVSMIFVNTSLEVAQQRNAQRDRVLPAKLVADSWNEVQQNLMKYQQIFGADRFHIIDNSGGLEDLDRQKNFDKVYNELQRFINTPPKHKKALEWIQNQKAQNNAKPTTNSGKSDGGVTSTN